MASQLVYADTLVAILSGFRLTPPPNLLTIVLYEESSAKKQAHQRGIYQRGRCGRISQTIGEVDGVERESRTRMPGVARYFVWLHSRKKRDISHRHMRLGALKYISPLRYMGTKIIANAFYGVLTSGRRSRAIMNSAIPRLDVQYGSLDKPLPYHLVPLPRKRLRQEKRVDLRKTAPGRVRGYTPMFDHAGRNRPMVAAGGGLRGSKARWKG